MHSGFLDGLQHNRSHWQALIDRRQLALFDQLG
jgi:hypothetical protein